jgi:fatty acid hydroxylase domain-containing protein 2
MSLHGRVADTIFRRDMLGPTFGNLASSLTALVLLEKLVIDWLLPSWVPTLQLLMETYGRWWSLVIGGNIVSFLSFWVCGGLMTIPALLGSKFWKIQQNRWLDIKMLMQSLPLISFNYVLAGVTLPAMALCVLPDSCYDFSALPDTYILVRDGIVWLLAEEILFFYSHRFFHVNKAAYARIHKIHHTWTAPVAWVAMYCHPVEQLVSNILPLAIGPLICHSHVASIAVYVAGGLFHTCAVHSGYWICDDNGMHDYHHEKFNVNFGMSGAMDYIYGTYQLPSSARLTQQTPSKSD